MFYIAQGGSKLYLVTTAGTASEIALPAGVTIDAARRPRFAVLQRQIVVANSPSENLWIDRFGTCRVLALRPPVSAPAVAAASGGSLIGKYRTKYTFVIFDAANRLVAESDFSPPSAESATLATQALSVSKIPLADRPISARRFYRTASGPGTEYFKWLDLQGNEAQSFTDGVGDAALAIASAPTDLGTPPARFEAIVEWKDRLWGKPFNDVDTVWYSANRKHYAWPAVNQLPIKPQGQDAIGVTGFMARRDELAIPKQNVIWKVIGDPPNHRIVKLAEQVGCIATDSIVVVRDRAYFLWLDGVYTWDESGVRSITDDTVKPWFTEDDTFNRAKFPEAFGRYNPAFNTYELHLAAAGSTSIDRWISYDIASGKWLGPHKTDAFTPTSAAMLFDDDGIAVPVIGDSAGSIWKLNQSSHNDGSVTVDYDVTARHNANTPDIDKVFGELSVLARVEASGTLTITPSIGWVNASAQGAAISMDLTKGRQRLRRLSTTVQGTGKILKLRFRQNGDDEGACIFGYEIPYFEAGRR